MRHSYWGKTEISFVESGRPNHIYFSFYLLDWLDLSAYGFPESVALSELPGSKFRGRHRDLPTDITTILRKDITDIICLLTEPEFRKFRVPNLLEKYESSGELTLNTRQECILGKDYNTPTLNRGVDKFVGIKLVSFTFRSSRLSFSHRGWNGPT